MEQIKINDGVVAVEDTAQSNREGRPVFEWTVATPKGSWSAEDLCGPTVGPEPSELEMLGTLMSFLGAAAESFDYRERTGDQGENEDLFPAPVVEWASANADEISMTQMEIEEGA